MMLGQFDSLDFFSMNNREKFHTTIRWATDMLPYVMKFCSTTIRDKIIPHAVLWFLGEAHGAGYNLDDSDTDDDDRDEEYEDADWF